MMNDMMCKCLRMMVMAGIVALAACAGSANRAPIEERSTVGSGGYAGGRASAAPAAGAEVADSDWTATVRPLGEAATTSSRALAGSDTASASPPPSVSASPPAPTSDSASRQRRSIRRWSVC